MSTWLYVQFFTRSEPAVRIDEFLHPEGKIEKNQPTTVSISYRKISYYILKSLSSLLGDLFRDFWLGFDQVFGQFVGQKIPCRVLLGEKTQCRVLRGQRKYSIALLLTIYYLVSKKS